MRLLFAGTPDAAVPSLRALLASRHEVVGVLTRPDAPVGRGRRLTPSPVRRVAEEAGIEVLTPRTLRDPEVLARITSLAPDAAPVVAYGSLVPPAALAIPAHGWINLHFSLLPAWRGAAPAQRAVLSGATATGMTTFRLDPGMDTGDVLFQESAAIGPTETAGELLDRLAIEGADLLVRSLDAIADGDAWFTPQPETGATHAAKLTAAEAALDFAQPSALVSAHIRGMSPAPGAWTTLDGARVKVLGIGTATAPEGLDLPPGRLHATRRSLFIGTGDTPLELGTVVPPGKRPMRAADWARGADLTPDATFTPAPPTADPEDSHR